MGAFSYTLLRKEPHIIPRKSPKSIGSIYSIPIDQLHPHPDNPFGIRDDPSMLELIESVKKHGVMVPAIARPKPVMNWLPVIAVREPVSLPVWIPCR